MSEPLKHSLNFLPQTFMILRAILRRTDNPEVRLTNGRLLIDGKELNLTGISMSDSQLSDRIRELARRLGLWHVSTQPLTQIWSAKLKEGPLSARELIECGQIAAFRHNPHEIDLVKQWRDRFIPYFVNQLPGLNAVERFDSSTTPEEWENELELAPVLDAWPRRILEDPYWKYAESPLPEMEPLALDDVWVDLSLSAPHDRPSEERLPEFLDQLNEHQRWRTEPAAFVLERIYGATALIGPPGCGKTTLLKWFARQMISKPHGRFLLPLFVPLRKYARTRLGELASPNGNLLEFALRQCGITHPTQLRMWTNTISYLTGGDRTSVLIMLDGWDEVPIEYRDLLLKEIDSLAYSFAILITSRPSGFPRLLPVSHFYEIASLSHDSSERLIRRWFAAAGTPDQADAVLHHLDEHSDLRRLARNPFLLSLLCGSSTWQTEHSAISRTSLYRKAIDLIVAHHNRNHVRAITSIEQRKVEQLALWLHADVPKAPRYVFDRADAQDCWQETRTLETILPSRLLSQLHLDRESFHFLHTTFQEYLAARGLLAEPPTRVEQRLQRHSYDVGWQEILSFAAGETGDENIELVLWQRLASMARNPDRFGIIFVRLTPLIIEAGVDDGGKTLLGVDLREELWQAIHRGVEVDAFVEAYLELDPQGLLSRIESQLDMDCDEAMKFRYLRIRGRIRGNESSQAVINTVLYGDDFEASIAIREGYSVLNVAGFKALRAAVSDETLEPHQRVRAMQILAAAKDSGIVATLKRLAAKETAAIKPLPAEAIMALGGIGDSSASSALGELLLEAEDTVRQESLIRALRFSNDPIARDHLIQEILSRLPDDPLVPVALEALAGKPFYEGTETVAGLLKCDDPKVRTAAAKAIGSSARTVYGIELARMAVEDESKSVRLAALQSLMTQGNPQAIYQLETIINDNSRDDHEQSRALATALQIFERLNASRNPGLLTVLRRLMLAALEKPHGSLAFEAVKDAHLLGVELLERLVEICDDDGTSDALREESCYTIAYILRYVDHPLKTKIESVLLPLLRREPDARNEEESVSLEPAELLAHAAANALTDINAACLLTEPGQTSRDALAYFSIRTGCLIFADKIINSHGLTFTNEFAAAQRSETKSESSLNISPTPTILEGPMALPAIDNHIRVLLFNASPTDMPTRKIDEEIRAIKAKVEASQHRDLIQLVQAEAARPGDLLHAMNKHQPHIVQFSGHGSRAKGIFICDEAGNSKAIGARALAALFESTELNVQVVVLNACYSKSLARAIVAIIPCVIGMRGTIGEDAARVFVASFYSALGFGHSVEKAFAQGVAALKLEDLPESHIPELITGDNIKASEIVLVKPYSAPSNRIT